MTKPETSQPEDPKAIILTDEKIEQLNAYCKDNDIPIQEFFKAMMGQPGKDITELTEKIAQLESIREGEIRLTHRKHVLTILTPDAREKFLEKIRENGNITLAAALVGVSRQRAYQIRDKDKEFAKSWDEAIEIATDNLEHEARRRAMQGTVKPVYYKGQVCGYMQEYSDKLMDTLLAAHRPGKYRPNVGDLPPGSEIAIIIRTGDGKQGQAIDVTPGEPEEEEALTE